MQLLTQSIRERLLANGKLRLECTEEGQGLDFERYLPHAKAA